MDATGWDRRYSDRPLLWSAGPNQFLEEFAIDLPLGRALDMACGEGRNALWLARLGWDVTAVDFSSVAVERGRALAREAGADVDFEVEDLLTWRPPERAFDLVVVAYLHLPRDEMSGVVHRACEAVAPGGNLFIVGHHVDNVAHGIGGPQSAAVLYTEEDLDGWCSLRTLRAERLTRHVDSEVGGSDAIDAILVAQA